MEEKKGPGGRPTKYKPEFCQMLIDHMAQGFSFESFVKPIYLYNKELNDPKPFVNRDTLYNWCTLFVEFSDAKKVGRGMQIHKFEQIGLDMATGVIEKGNATAFVWASKNMIGWTDKHEVVTGEDSSIHINLIRQGSNKEDD